MAASSASEPPSPPAPAPGAPSVRPLPPEALLTHCTLDHLDFATTDDLEDGEGFVHQERPVAAIELGVTTDHAGYNIFALGPSGTGKYTLVKQFVEQRAAAQPPPDDWCYVYDFEKPSMPLALRLSAGKGKELQADMKRLVEGLRAGLSSAFESDEVAARRRALEEEFEARQKTSLEELQERARGHGLALVSTPSGFGVAPRKGDEVMPPEEFKALPEEERKRLESEMEALQGELHKVMLRVPRWKREFAERARKLNEEVAALVAGDVIDDVVARYEGLPGVVAYLDAVRTSVPEDLSAFLEDGEQRAEGGGSAELAIAGALGRAHTLRRYEVNVIVDSGDASGAPVVYESNPTYVNLVGRVEQTPMMGVLLTDFTLIKPGVLHRANGGYLILDALKVLASPMAWEALKRALQFRQIRIESPLQSLGYASTVSLEPEPIPLDVKVILMGDRQLYYLLAQGDPDFNEHFKIAADFDDEFVRDDETTASYARLIATMARRDGLLPFERAAVCRVIEHGARLTGDAERVTAQMRAVVDLLQEADHYARREPAELVSAAHVQQAIDAQVYRSDRVRARMRDEMVRETILVDTAGAEVGQVNGLSVLSLGTFSFGRPSRITARAHLGKGEVVDIEREVELGGPLHSKGVLILSGFLRGRYAQERPLSLGASLVFEQSYGGVDGDSASSAELYALLSAISGVPIRQSFAVTGSVNQSGEVQAIGGVNEKIEGFFDLCAARGLTGEQGVLIPQANVKHLMLRQDVVDAAVAIRFSVYPVATVDEGIEILTGVAAGVRDAEGRYPEGTVNRMVADRLAALAEASRAFAKPKEGAAS